MPVCISGKSLEIPIHLFHFLPKRYHPKGSGYLFQRPSGWSTRCLVIPTKLFYDYVVVADSERKLCQSVTEFGRVCERRKLQVNVGKSKVMRCTRNEVGARLNVMLNGEALEEVDQLYLQMVEWKHMCVIE